MEETILKLPRSGYIALGISPNFYALLRTARVKVLAEFILYIYTLV